MYSVATARKLLIPKQFPPGVRNEGKRGKHLAERNTDNTKLCIVTYGRVESWSNRGGNG